MELYIWRAFALALFVAIFTIWPDMSDSWSRLSLLTALASVFYVAGYSDAATRYRGKLWEASLNLERMTREVTDHKKPHEV